MIKYAGIGSRETPQPIMATMQMIAAVMAGKGFQLRSGRAKGADTAFETGCDSVHGLKVIRVPTLYQKWLNHAQLFHPAWDKCDEYAQGCHARNSGIILGDDLNDPVNFVVCWTLNGQAVGGTGQALRIATVYGIPVFNLFDDPGAARLWQWLGEKGL